MEVIVKPTTACNGSCVYCAADGAPHAGRLFPESCLGELFEPFRAWLRGQDGRALRFIWHGGEPMLCGPGYYRTVIRQQRRIFGRDMWRVRNIMQSNLTLLTPEWIGVLRELLADQPIGTSFDIVEGVRGLTSGASLAGKWFDAIELLKRSGVRIGAVYVVHRRSLGRARDLYWYFRNVHRPMRIRYNPLYCEGRGARAGSEDLRITPEQYGQFLLDLLDVWLADGMRGSAMPLGEWYRAWHGDPRLCCDSRGMCHENHLGIDPDGTVYTCGRAADSRAHPLGHILRDRLEDLLERPPHGDLALRPGLLRDGVCRTCRWWDFCHGGCPMMGWIYRDDLLAQDPWCEARRMVFQRFEERFGPPVGRRRSSPVAGGAGHG